MRVMIMAAAALVAACGASTQGADAPAASERTLPAGAIIAIGENWTFNADPGPQAMSFVVDDGAEPVEIAEVWTPPQTTESGYRLASGELTLDLIEAPCTQDNIPYPMRATVSYGSSHYEGCAAVRWDYQLVALMPQIDACIAQSSGARMVSYAGQGPDGATWVRMLDDGAGLDCRVIEGNVVVSRRDEAVRIATESAALFVRGPGENPGGECYEAPEVRSPSGEVLGWMLDPMGC